MSNDRAFTAVDLFCGAGGLTRGLSRAGFDVALGVDYWGPAIDSYRLNFDHPGLQADVAELSAARILRTAGLRRGELDLLAGGPPCQGFSIQRIGPDADVRNLLIMEFARLINQLEPEMFLMENVPGLLGKRGKPTASSFESHVAKAGYEFIVARVNAADFGVPQIRRRVVYIGWREGMGPFHFPLPRLSPDSYRTVWNAIGGLPPAAAPGSPCPRVQLHESSRLSGINVERLKLIPPGGGFEHLPVELRARCHRQGPDRIGHRNVYGRLAPHQPAVTITARFDSFTRGKFAHPYEHRNITLREGARLQTFPDSHRFVGTREDIAALIGNSVPPKLAEVIGRALVRHLTQKVIRRR